MNAETIHKLALFNGLEEETEVRLGDKYSKFEPFIKEMISGEGMVGEESYLILWAKNELEQLNHDYEVDEYLHDILLIGSDGGDMAYGINAQGKYVEVPFIGMDDDEVEVVAGNFDEFITYLWDNQ